MSSGSMRNQEDPNFTPYGLCSYKMPNKVTREPTQIHDPHVMTLGLSDVSMWQNCLFALTRWAFWCYLLCHCAIAIPDQLREYETLCDGGMFGAPNPHDCYDAMFSVPYRNVPGLDSPDAKATRIFAEPQYLSPPFSALENAYAPKAIVQLPKMWKSGTSMHRRSLTNFDPVLPLRCPIFSKAALNLFTFN